MSKERRTETREALAVPVQVGNGIDGMTRDFSDSGLFFETERGELLDSVLNLEFSFDTPNVHFRFVAQAAVLRHECIGQTQGVAVKLLALQMEILA